MENSKAVEHKEELSQSVLVDLIAKWRGTSYCLNDIDVTKTSIGDVKVLLSELTSVQPCRQKLIGLAGGKCSRGTNNPSSDDATLLSEIRFKKNPHQFMMVGTPEDQIFVDPGEKGDLPEVFDDFELDFTMYSDQWHRSLENEENLRKFTDSTEVHFINPPREGKHLLVVDLDHTLLDFSSSDANQVGMKRPFMDEFLTSAYEDYDLVVWSQTSWRWLEMKLTELGMLVHPAYRICFVLDKTSMFPIVSTIKGKDKKHQVKPLQILWTKFPYWGAHNTVHIDDLKRNFALNPQNGIKIKAYYRKDTSSNADQELVVLAIYLKNLSVSCTSFSDFDHTQWKKSHLIQRQDR